MTFYNEKFMDTCTYMKVFTMQLILYSIFHGKSYAEVIGLPCKLQKKYLESNCNLDVCNDSRKGN